MKLPYRVNIQGSLNGCAIVCNLLQSLGFVLVSANRTYELKTFWRFTWYVQMVNCMIPLDNPVRDGHQKRQRTEYTPSSDRDETALQYRLEQAIESENYEEAARIRDLIKKTV